MSLLPCNLCSALASIIQARVDITQVRVKRTDDGTVDVTRLDIIGKNCLLNDLVLLLGVEGDYVESLHQVCYSGHKRCFMHASCQVRIQEAYTLHLSLTVLWFTTSFELCFRSDVIFFVLDSLTGEVIHPEVVLQ